MKYVISDIHGHYDRYTELLKKISFGPDDELYVLGDVIDRGEHGMKILQDMMMRSNVIPIAGNHEYMALNALPWLLQEITDDSLSSFTSDKIDALTQWIAVGGDTSIKEFAALSKEEKEDILDYLNDFSLYEEVYAGGRKYLLVHAGLKNFKEDFDIDHCDISDLIFETCDYDKCYFDDCYLVTGHLPVREIRRRYGIETSEEHQDDVLFRNHHIATDCGCGYGLRLAAVCLDTLQVYYV